MSLVGGIRAILAWIWTNRTKFAAAVFSALVFAFLIFPYNDLSELVTAQVSNATRNRVYLQFETLKLSLFPQLGANMERVRLEAVNMPGISAQEITITPSLSALISRKPMGRVTARGILGGEIDAKASSGGTSERGAELTKLDIEATRLNLTDIRALAKLPMALKGQLEVKTNGQLDMSFSEQPDLAITIKINKFEMPPSLIPTPNLGDISLPELKISILDIKGKLSGGRLLIENARIGNPGDDLVGTVKGSINMNFQPTPAGPAPQFGGYSLDIDLEPSAGFRSRASFLLGVLPPTVMVGNRMRFKLSAESFAQPARFNPLN